MDSHPPNNPGTTSTPPPRLFQPLPRLFPRLPAAPTSPKPSPPPSHLTIQALTSSTLPSFKRLTTLLFPIRYHDRFFTDILCDRTTSSLSRLALWRDGPRPWKRKRPDDADDSDDFVAEEGTVVGGIRCRLEDMPMPTQPNLPSPAPSPSKQLYVQTLGVLSPYRSLGIATALLDEVVETGIREYGIGAVYAHVWEANAEALEWYLRRGFMLEEGLVEGYYRRLRPAGARVVRRGVGVGEYVRVGRRGGVGVGEGGGWGDGGGGGEGSGRGGGRGEGGGGDEDAPGLVGGLDGEPGGIGNEVDKASLDRVINDTIIISTWQDGDVRKS